MRQNNGCLDVIGAINYLASIICLFVFLSEEIISNRFFFYATIFVSIVVVIYLFIRTNKHKERADDVVKEYNIKENQLEKDYVKKYKIKDEEIAKKEQYVLVLQEKIKKEYADKEENIKKEYNKKETALTNSIKYRESKCSERESRIKLLLETTNPFSLSASLQANMSTYVFDDAISYLRYKTRPAPGKADEIEKGLKVKFHECERRYREMLYKYEFLLNAFPDISNYIDKEEELLRIAEYMSYKDCDETRDRTRDFLSDEEWKNLSVTAKNQLALDRYVKGRKKSEWAVGRDYEMSCAHSLRSKGYGVEMHGIENGVNDLGRDLIASKFEKNLFGENCSKGEVLIIQCKYWKKERQIKENVIMQLYGSTIAFIVEYREALGKEVKISPVLMIPQFSTLSETALRFVKFLNISIWRLDSVDFPRIKCNINAGNKIYHLPFDQQYDRTQITKEGEFYAYKVSEAEEKGFRRAMRHIICD